MVRTGSGEVKAYHNICRHRGNKLVWNDQPREETCGTCRQFTCKYHAWRYDLDGKLTFVQQEEEFFDLDKARYGLVSVHCEVWEGFIFVNFAEEPEQSLTDFLGPMITNLAGYPFEKLTSRFHYRSEVKANWKLYMDAFQEFYHAPILHANQSPTSFSKAAAEAGFEAPHYQIDGPHRLVSTSGIRAWEMDAAMRKPIEDICQSGLFGPWNGPDLGEMPVGLNPAKCSPWGLDSFQLFPNFVILFWGQGWYLTYHYWPTSYNTHIFEGNIYFPPARTPRERVAQELGRGVVQGIRTAGRQHAGGHPDHGRVARGRQVPLLRPGGAAAAPAQGDRHLDRRVSAQYGGSDPMTAMLPTEFADLEMFSEWCLPTERAALREAPRQFDGRDAGVLRRHHRTGGRGAVLLRQVSDR